MGSGSARDKWLARHGASREQRDNETRPRDSPGILRDLS
jgi:hypothetical protein